MKSEVKCPLCGQKNYTFYLQKPRRRIVRCQNDGLVFVNPQLSEGEIDNLYNTNYFASDKKRGESSVGYYSYLAEKPLLLPYFRNKIRLLRKFRLPRLLNKKSKILEVGCGPGFFLEAARVEELNVLGIDISRPAVKLAQKQGLNAKAIDLFAGKFKSNLFDAVVAFHLIEHVLDPLAFMREIYRITKPGGLILLATPRAGGYLNHLMGKHWFSYRHQEHLYFFSQQTITLLLSKSGFWQIRCFGDETRWYPLEHLLNGVKYYFNNNAWQGTASVTEKVLNFLHLTKLQIPFPLDTLIVTAKKP